MSEVQHYKSHPEEVKKLRAVTQKWQKEKFWSFDQTLSFLSLKPGQMFYLDDVVDNEGEEKLRPSWGAVAMLSIAEDSSELVYLYVPEEKRGKGVAKQFFEAVLEKIKTDFGTVACHLEVRPSNAIAISLYESIGFQSTGMRKKYYSDGEDAHTYSLELK